jgi:hypothetical protein
MLALQHASNLAAEVIGEEPAALEVDIIQHPNMKLVLRGPMRLLAALGGLVMTGTGGAFLLAHLCTFGSDIQIERLKSQEAARRATIVACIDEEAEKAIRKRFESVKHIKDPKRRLHELAKLRQDAGEIGKDMADLPHVEFKKLVEEGEK